MYVIMNSADDIREVLVLPITLIDCLITQGVSVPFIARKQPKEYMPCRHAVLLLRTMMGQRREAKYSLEYVGWLVNKDSLSCCCLVNLLRYNW